MLICLSLALIAGLLMSRAAKAVRLPAVTAYLLTGLLLGPFFLGRLGLSRFGFGFGSLVAVEGYGILTQVALGFIAFVIGNEFRLSALKHMGRRAVTVGIAQAVITTALVDIALVALHFARPDVISLASAITLGSIAGLARERVAQLRAQGVKAGLMRIRYMRPFPARQIVEALAGAAAVGVLEKDVSFGAEGTVMTNVCSALQQAGNAVPVVNFVGGLGGDDITQAQMRGMFEVLEQIAAGRIAPEDCPRVGFLGVDSVADEFGNPCCGGCGDAGFVAVAGGESEGVRDGACITNAEGGR
mgnify:CR=1 FL=1